MKCDKIALAIVKADTNSIKGWIVKTVIHNHKKAIERLIGAGLICEGSGRNIGA